MRVPMVITHILRHKLLSRKSSTRVQHAPYHEKEEKTKKCKEKTSAKASILGQTYFSIEGATW